MSRIEDQIIRGRERGDVTIDEIMRAVVESQDMALAWYRAEEGSYGVLNHQYLVIGELIAAALADAQREGAEATREACAKACGETYTLAIAHGDAAIEIEALCYPAGMTADNIRALPLPLPTGPRQAVRLTDDLVREIAYQADCFGEEFDITGAQTDKLSRAIETAVLAANNLGDGNA
jgi:hypothetical protein